MLLYLMVCMVFIDKREFGKIPCSWFCCAVFFFGWEQTVNAASASSLFNHRIQWMNEPWNCLCPVCVGSTRSVRLFFFRPCSFFLSTAYKCYPIHTYIHEDAHRESIHMWANMLCMYVCMYVQMRLKRGNCYVYMYTYIHIQMHHQLFLAFSSPFVAFTLHNSIVLINTSEAL